MKILDFFKEKNSSDNIEEIKIVTPKDKQPECIIVMCGVCTKGKQHPLKGITLLDILILTQEKYLLN